MVRKIPVENAILITVDCLRPDHLSCYGYDKVNSLNIDRIAEKGALFLNAFANGCGTPASFPSILTSTYPLMYGDYKDIRGRTTIAEVLKEKGYSTAAFHSNAYLSRYYGYHKGFDKFYDSIGTEGTEVKARKLISKNKTLHKILRRVHDFVFPNRFSVGYTTADELNEKAVSWLKGLTKKFFLWIHYMDVHNPHVPPPQSSLGFSKDEIRELNRKASKVRLGRAKPEILTERELKLLIDIYNSEIEFVDHQLGVFYEKLESMDLLENTLLIITADHGTAFLEHGYLGHPPELYDKMIHVPLVISSPALDLKPAKVKNVISLLDVSPTILDALGEEENASFIGNSLLPRMTVSGREREIIGEVANPPNKLKIDLNMRKTYLRTSRWKFIENAGKMNELYKIDEDPGERKNLIEEEAEIADRFLSKVRKHQEWENEMNITMAKRKIKNNVKRLKFQGKI